MLRAVDFATADGRLVVARSYNSLPWGYTISNSGDNTVAAEPLGLAGKWQFDFLPELHMGGSINGPVSSPNATMLLVLPDGSAFGLKMKTDGSGTWAPDTNLAYNSKQYTLTLNTGFSYPAQLQDMRNSSYEFKVVDPEGRTWIFKTYPMSINTTPLRYRIGRPIQMIDKDGYTLTYAYSATDNSLTSITDSFGRSITFTWYQFFYTAYTPRPANSEPEAAAVREITLPDSSKIRYTYDPAPQLTAPSTSQIKRLVKYERLNAGGTVVDSITYHYEDTRFPKHITGWTDHRNVRMATYAYDGLGRGISEEGPGGTDKFTIAYTDTATQFQRTVTNGLNKSATYIFTRTYSNSPIARLTAVNGTASTNCPASTTAVTHDGNGFIQETTDEEGRKVRYVRDTLGRPTSITRGYGTAQAVTTTLTYHATLNRAASVVEPGRTTTYTWNATTGRLDSYTVTDTTSHSLPYATNGQTRTWAFTYGTAGNLLTVDGPLAGTGDTVTYGYTAAGYLNQVTNQVGHITQITALNARGQPTTVVDANGVTSDLAYDDMGRLTSVTVNPGASQAVTSFTYDNIGQITRITRPDGSYFDYVYSNARRLTSVTSNTGEKIEYTHDLVGNVLTRVVKTSGGTIVFNQTQTFDELGRLLSHIGANSQTTIYGYEKNNNLKTVTDPRSGLYQYAYDSLNRLIRETDQDSSQVNLTLNGVDAVTTYSDPRSLQTTYVRNGFGEVIQRASPDSGTTVYVRDARGLVTQETDGRGVVINRTFDNAGRILTKTYPSAPAEDVTYTWDDTAGGNKGIGRLSKVAGQSTLVEFVFDVRGNIVTDTRTIGGQVYTTTYVYDLADRVTEITYPSGRIVTYARDATGRITGVTTQRNALASVVNVATTIVRQPLSNLVASLTYSNGITEANTYTLDYELNALVCTDGATSIVNRTHQRTDLLNLTGITDLLTPANSATFGYTPSNRLSLGTGPWGTLTWAYDGVGNRTQEVLTPPSGPAVTDTYAYPAASNRLLTVTRAAQTIRAFTYDGAGNILTDNRAGSTTTYTYNARNRLATATSGALVWGYTYNGLEQLAVRTLTVGGTDLTHFVHDRFGNVIAESNGTGPTGTLREYIWLPEAEIAPTHQSRAQVDRPLAVVEDVLTGTPVTWLVHVDHLNRPVRMTDAGKAVVWDAVWTPWGLPHAITGTGANNQRFPGQWFQLEAGLHYNWHRHYDPSLGRYTQPDPLGFVDGPSVYGYGIGSPGMMVDPSGLDVITLGSNFKLQVNVLGRNFSLPGGSLASGLAISYPGLSGGQWDIGFYAGASKNYNNPETLPSWWPSWLPTMLGAGSGTEIGYHCGSLSDLAGLGGDFTVLVPGGNWRSPTYTGLSLKFDPNGKGCGCNGSSPTGASVTFGQGLGVGMGASVGRTVTWSLRHGWRW